MLEGILPFEPSVVRVGGRSKSMALKEKNLQPLLEARRARPNPTPNPNPNPTRYLKGYIKPLLEP